MQNTQTAIMRIIERANQYPSNEIKDYILRIIIQEQESILLEKEQIMRAYKSGEIGEIYELNAVKTLTAKQYYENNYGK